MIPLIRTLFGVMLGGSSRVSPRWRPGSMRRRRLDVPHDRAPRLRPKRGAWARWSSSSPSSARARSRLLWPNKTGAFGKALTVSASNIPPVDGEPFTQHRRQVLSRPHAGRIDGALLEVPHLGCTVPWEESEDQFHCPCHGSIYAYNGERLGGPAPRPMDYMGVTVDTTGTSSSTPATSARRATTTAGSGGSVPGIRADAGTDARTRQAHR